MIVAAIPPPTEARVADRNILAATESDGTYRLPRHIEIAPEQTIAPDPDRFVAARVRRLKALRRAGVVERRSEDRLVGARGPAETRARLRPQAPWLRPAHRIAIAHRSGPPSEPRRRDLDRPGVGCAGEGLAPGNRLRRRGGPGNGPSQARTGGARRCRRPRQRTYPRAARWPRTVGVTGNP